MELQVTSNPQRFLFDIKSNDLDLEELLIAVEKGHIALIEEYETYRKSGKPKSVLELHQYRMDKIGNIVNVLTSIMSLGNMSSVSAECTFTSILK